MEISIHNLHVFSSLYIYGFNIYSYNVHYYVLHWK